MNHLIEYEKFINEGVISNKIELWKSKISTTFKSLKNIQKVLGYIITILSVIGIVSMGLLFGLFLISTMNPEFVEECVKKSGKKAMYEKTNQDYIIESIVNKFYNDEDLQKKIKEAAESKDIKKIKDINTKLKTIFTEEEQQYLNNLIKYYK